MDVFELTRNLNITSAYSHNEDDRDNAYDNNNDGKTTIVNDMMTSIKTLSIIMI